MWGFFYGYIKPVIKIIVKIISLYCVMTVVFGVIHARDIDFSHKCVFVSPRDAVVSFNKKYNRYLYSNDKDISLSEYGNILSDLNAKDFSTLDGCMEYFFHTNEFSHLDILSQNTVYHNYLKDGVSPPKGSNFYFGQYYTIASCDLQSCSENIENVIFDRHGALIAVMESVLFNDQKIKNLDSHRKYIILERWVLVRKQDLNNDLKYFIALSMENLYANTPIRIQKWHYVVSDH